VLEQSPDSAEAADALAECGTLVELLQGRQAALAATLEGAFPELRATVWQSEASVQAAVQVSNLWLGDVFWQQVLAY
jgi:MoxR-like ATPase